MNIVSGVGDYNDIQRKNKNTSATVSGSETAARICGGLT